MSDPLRLPQRLELEIDPELYERIEELSVRSGRSVPEIIQALISCSFPMDPAERQCSANRSAEASAPSQGPLRPLALHLQPDAEHGGAIA